MNCTPTRSVASAYGFPPDFTDVSILEQLLALNQALAGRCMRLPALRREVPRL